ncbi:MAG TPA: hypothetical protein VLG10_03870 [Methylomirabilota bacterium]|nr:hypothetical protein [Methylomirabilota bacterium]
MADNARREHQAWTIPASGQQLRRYPILGGVARWAIVWVTGTLALGAAALGAAELLVIIGVVGVVAYRAASSLIVELSPRGLTRGIVVQGRFLGRTTVMAWHAVASVHSDWRAPGDDSALATVVRDPEGRVIAFSTAMGLHNYWECLAGIVAATPAATHSGLTEAILADGPPGRATLLAAARTAAVLGLVIAVLVGVYYLWAQGRSSLSRDLEPVNGGEPAAGASGRSSDSTARPLRAWRTRRRPRA